ncbi:MAG: YbaN family protein [Paracoccus sp. (in: a-proteobacteria)]
MSWRPDMRHLWLTIGWTFVAMGIVGAALPVVPTVPFLLIAAWAFARSSPALKQRILDHPTYGPSVRAWQERGAVGTVAKVWAISAMTGGIGLSWWIGVETWVVVLQASVCAAVAVFLLTRPSQ